MSAVAASLPETGQSALPDKAALGVKQAINRKAKSVALAPDHRQTCRDRIGRLQALF